MLKLYRMKQMQSIWITCCIIIQFCILVYHVLDIVLLINCFGGDIYPDHLHKDCIPMINTFIFTRALVTLASIVCAILAIIGFIKQQSMFILPWIIYFGFCQTQHIVAIHFYTESKPNKAFINALTFVAFVAVWLITFFSCLKFL